MIRQNRLYTFICIAISTLFLAGCWPFGKNNEHISDTHSKLMVINVLDKADYDDCHIKGSVHIDFDEFEAKIKTLNKRNQYVVYCADYMCMSSGFCAKLLKEAGFENVWAYEGGMAEWYQKGYPFEGVAEMDYLKGENINLGSDEESGVPHIAAEDLLAKMKEFGLI